MTLFIAITTPRLGSIQLPPLLKAAVDAVISKEFSHFATSNERLLPTHISYLAPELGNFIERALLSFWSDDRTKGAEAQAAISLIDECVVSVSDSEKNFSVRFNLNRNGGNHIFIPDSRLNEFIWNSYSSLIQHFIKELQNKEDPALQWDPYQVFCTVDPENPEGVLQALNASLEKVKRHIPFKIGQIWSNLVHIFLGTLNHVKPLGEFLSELLLSNGGIAVKLEDIPYYLYVDPVVGSAGFTQAHTLTALYDYFKYLDPVPQGAFREHQEIEGISWAEEGAAVYPRVITIKGTTEEEGAQGFLPPLSSLLPRDAADTSSALSGDAPQPIKPLTRYSIFRRPNAPLSLSRTNSVLLAQRISRKKDGLSKPALIKTIHEGYRLGLCGEAIATTLVRFFLWRQKEHPKVHCVTATNTLEPHMLAIQFLSGAPSLEELYRLPSQLQNALVTDQLKGLIAGSLLRYLLQDADIGSRNILQKGGDAIQIDLGCAWWETEQAWPMTAEVYQHFPDLPLDAIPPVFFHKRTLDGMVHGEAFPSADVSRLPQVRAEVHEISLLLILTSPLLLLEIFCAFPSLDETVNHKLQMEHGRLVDRVERLKTVVMADKGFQAFLRSGVPESIITGFCAHLHQFTLPGHNHLDGEYIAEASYLRALAELRDPLSLSPQAEAVATAGASLAL